MNISISISDLERLLQEQKRLTITKLLDCSSYYNPANTPSHTFSLELDKPKFEELGMKTQFPSDFNVLKKYIPSDK